jgi:ferrochelatase
VSDAVLLMAYGAPASIDDVPAYFAHIRGGRPASAEAVGELQARYRRIGGTSPLREVTEAQASGVARVLRGRGRPIPVAVGMKHAPPFIADVVGDLALDGVHRIAALALAPHYSRMSIASYFSAAADAAGAHGIALRTRESWHDHPGFIATLASRVQTALRGTADPASAAIVFTAHSLPERILSWHDPYPEQLLQTSALTAAAAGVSRWRFAYQSASHTGEPWLGPDLLDVLRDLAAGGSKDVVVCPVGFVSDHLEVLFDIDVEAREIADSLGLRLIRTASLNDASDFLAILAGLAADLLDEERPS